MPEAERKIEEDVLSIGGHGGYMVHIYVKTHGTVASIIRDTSINFIKLFKFSKRSVKTIE